MCGADMCGSILMASGVATSPSFMINPPSTNSQIVCRRKDRGGCGCSHRWRCSFRFCLISWQTSYEVTMCPLFLMLFDVVLCCVVVLWW